MSRWDLFTSSYDTVSKRMGYIRSDHAYIHEGLAYGINYELADFDNGESRYFLFETPADKYIHFKNVHAIDCIAVIYENATIDETGATEINTYNRNRIDDSPANSTVKLLDVDPDLVDAYPIKKYQGSFVVDTDEAVLKQGHQYVIEITNLGGQTADVFVESLFYEEGKGVV